MSGDDLALAVTAAVSAVPGLRPARPLGPAGAPWLPLPAADGVEQAPGRITVRVVAHALPLPPLLAKAAAGIRAALTGTAWESAVVRLVVCDLDAAAFEKVRPITPP